MSVTSHTHHPNSFASSTTGGRRHAFDTSPRDKAHQLVFTKRYVFDLTQFSSQGLRAGGTGDGRRHSSSTSSDTHLSSSWRRASSKKDLRAAGTGEEAVRAPCLRKDGTLVISPILDSYIIRYLMFAKTSLAGCKNTSIHSCACWLLSANKGGF